MLIPQHTTLTLIYDYNYWATHQLLNACAALTPTQWAQPQGHSWDSVHGLLVHMLGAERIWYTRWQGTSPKALAKPEEFPTLADVRAAWAETESQMLAFLARQEDASLQQVVNFTNTRGEPFAFPLGQLMLHVANHSTHHRGELAAMLALLNIPHPETDMYLYYRQT